MAGCRIHFNVRGPGNLRTMASTTVMSSDGFAVDVDRLYTWVPAPVQFDHSVAEVEEFVGSIFRHSKTWMAAGINLRQLGVADELALRRQSTGPRPSVGGG